MMYVIEPVFYYGAFGTTSLDVDRSRALAFSTGKADVWPTIQLEYRSVHELDEDNCGDDEMEGNDEIREDVTREKPDFRGCTDLVALCTKSCWSTFLLPYHDLLSPVDVFEPSGRFDDVGLRVVNELDVLDTKRSDIEYFASSGRMSHVRRYVFHNFDLKKNAIFRIPEIINSFATQYFVDAYYQAEMTGLSFHPVDGE